MVGGKISMQIRNLIVREAKHNQSQRKIAEKFGVSRGAVQKIIPKHQKFGSVADRPGREAKRKSSARTDDLIIRQIKKDPRTTVRAIKERLDLTISDRTIRRRMAERDLMSYFAKKRPMISKVNKN